MSQDAQASRAFVNEATSSIRSALLRTNVPTAKLLATHYPSLRDARSENLVVSAVPAVTAIRFMAGQIFEFFSKLGRRGFSSGEDFFPREGDVVLIVADQDEPELLQGVALVRGTGERLIYDPSDKDSLADENCPNYVSASYDLVWTMVRDDDAAVKRLIAAYIAEATREGVTQLAAKVQAAGGKPSEDVAVTYEYYDDVDEALYELMADNLMKVVGDLGRDKRISGQFKNIGWLLAE